MKKSLKTLALIALLFTVTSQAGAAEYGTFASFYTAGGLSFWDWALIIGGTILFAGITFVTFGGTAAAAPAWMAAVGTWIGSSVGLSGIAAANFGLALLGGGSVAAGGLGVAGGVTVLTLAFSGVSEFVFYGTGYVLEQYSQNKFAEANKKMQTLPVPRNDKGGKAYREIVEYLRKNFKDNVSVSSDKGQVALRHAIEVLKGKMCAESDSDYILKNTTLLALLYLQTNEYQLARDMAGYAIDSAVKNNLKHTLPCYIRALAELAIPDRRCPGDTLQDLRKAFLLEPDNKLIPLMTGCCMDRMIYKYHYGKMDISALSDFCEIISNSKIDKGIAAQAMEIFVSRCVIELKRTQQDILNVARDRSMMEDEQIVRELKNRLDRHKALLETLRSTALSKIQQLAGKFPEDSKVKPDELPGILDLYKRDLSNLESALERR